MNALRDFLSKNKLSGMVRAHEVMQEGFRFHVEDASTLTTVFSAPNYCGKYANKAAYLVIDNVDPNLSIASKSGCISAVQFEEANQPLPAMRDSAKDRLTDTIHETCPYMPTSLGGFITKSMELHSGHVARKTALEEKLTTQLHHHGSQANLVDKMNLPES